MSTSPKNTPKVTNSPPGGATQDFMSILIKAQEAQMEAIQKLSQSSADASIFQKIPIFKGTGKPSVEDWIAEISKASLLTNEPTTRLAYTYLTGTPHK